MAYDVLNQTHDGGGGEADTSLLLDVTSVSFSFTTFLTLLGRRETEHQGIGREVRNPSGFCCR